MTRVASAASIIVCLTACGGSPARETDTLPGRTRPLLQHGWKHPRDFTFAPVSFKPPDPAASLAKTANGLRAFVLESPGDRTVHIVAAIPLGRLYEQADEAGAAAFLVRALTETGSGDSAAQARSQRLDALGSRLSVTEYPDLTVLTLDVLPDMWREGVSLIVDSLRTPALDDAAILAFRPGSGYSGVTAGTGGEGFRPAIELARVLGGYPLAPPDAGTRVRPAAVRSLAARTLRPDAVVLAVGGRISRAAVQRALEESARDWSTRDNRAGIVASGVAPVPAVRFHAIDSPETNEWVPRQGWIAIGRALGAVADGELPALALMAEILDNRLNIATREVRGLSNRTSFVLPDTANRAGLLHIRSGGRQEAVAPLVKVSLDEVRRLYESTDPITDDELRRAKGTLVLGAWQRSLDGAGQASATFAMETVRHGDTDRLLRWPAVVEAVSVEQVKQEARKHLDPASMTAVVVGPIAHIQQARHPRWPATLDELGFKLPSDTKRGTE